MAHNFVSFVHELLAPWPLDLHQHITVEASRLGYNLVISYPGSAKGEGTRLPVSLLRAFSQKPDDLPPGSTPQKFHHLQIAPNEDPNLEHTGLWGNILDSNYSITSMATVDLNLTANISLYDTTHHSY